MAPGFEPIPSEIEPPPITTRPGLPPLLKVFEDLTKMVHRLIILNARTLEPFQRWSRPLGNDMIGFMIKGVKGYHIPGLSPVFTKEEMKLRW